MNDTINQVGAGAPALKVTTTSVTKLYIEKAENLDPITVFLEDFEPKKGKITVSCWGKSWTAYWGGMWDGMTVGQFFTELTADYIIGYFSPQLSSRKFSGEALAAKARREVLRLRRARDLDEDEARSLYDEADGLENAESVDNLWGGYSELMARLFGDEWWYAADDATEPNPEYEYLCRIIKAVQQALSSQPECGCCGRTDECDADCDARQAAPAAPVQAEHCGSYVTTPGEMIAGIALRQLGDESRWVEIRDLNAPAFPDMEPNDYLPVGTKLAMPKAAPPAHPDAGALVEALRKAKPEWAKKVPSLVVAFIREAKILDADMIEEMLLFAAEIAALASKGGAQ